MTGWQIERETHPGTSWPHTLRWGDEFVRRVSDVQADEMERLIAAAAPVESLPPGVRAGFLLDAKADLPEGWQIPDDVGWARGGAPFSWRVPVERVSQPATERVPLHELPRRTIPGRAWRVERYEYDGVRFVAYGNHDPVTEEGPSVIFEVAADGTVEVLVER